MAAYKSRGTHDGPNELACSPDFVLRRARGRLGIPPLLLKGPVCARCPCAATAASRALLALALALVLAAFGRCCSTRSSGSSAVRAWFAFALALVAALRSLTRSLVVVDQPPRPLGGCRSHRLVPAHHQAGGPAHKRIHALQAALHDQCLMRERQLSHECPLDSLPGLLLRGPALLRVDVDHRSACPQSLQETVDHALVRSLYSRRVGHGQLGTHIDRDGLRETLLELAPAGLIAARLLDPQFLNGFVVLEHDPSTLGDRVDLALQAAHTVVQTRDLILQGVEAPLCGRSELSLAHYDSLGTAMPFGPRVYRTEVLHTRYGLRPQSVLHTLALRA
jgi:hypothetical protein